MVFVIFCSSSRRSCSLVSQTLPYSGHVAIAARCLGTTFVSMMPYKPEDRPPMSEKQKKLYPQVDQEFTDEGYPVLRFKPRPSGVDYVKPPPRPDRPVPAWRSNLVHREHIMKHDQDWPSVWPTARTFSPSTVPLPLRQSYVDDLKRSVPLGKYANTELLKIPNFLHLTPKAIKRHCDALKKFCTAWPEGLETDEDCDTHFPVTYIKNDYVHATANIRDQRSRIVRLKIKLSSLELNETALDKIKRLAAERYDPETDELTIVAGACPLRGQNQDYADFLLTALYYESNKHEEWEDEKPECDWERFYWEKSHQKKAISDYLSRVNEDFDASDDSKLEDIEGVKEYKESLEKLYIKEDREAINDYRKSVEKLLGLQAQASL